MTINSRATRTQLYQELEEKNEQLRRAQSNVVSIRADNERLSARLEVEQRRTGDLETRLRTAQRNLELPVNRRDMEALTRVRLVSLIEEGINEARRKGMIEAEGLMSRHHNLSAETDAELMRGVIRTYQGRLETFEAQKREREEAAKREVKLDTRTFAEKTGLNGRLGALPPVHEFRAPAWWSITPASPSGQVVANVLPPSQARPASPTSSFNAFDAAATRLAFVDGKRVTVKGSSGGTYVLSRDGAVFRCSCPAWQFSKAPAEQRTCKHLGKYFGEAKEAARIKNVAQPITQCHCGTALIRGQCVKHTTDWKGPELCTCGRQFASCKAAWNTLSGAQRYKGHQPAIERNTVPA